MLLQIYSVFTVESWLGFGHFWGKKLYSSQNVCFSDTFRATFTENIVVHQFYPLFFPGAFLSN